MQNTVFLNSHLKLSCILTHDKQKPTCCNHRKATLKLMTSILLLPQNIWSSCLWYARRGWTFLSINCNFFYLITIVEWQSSETVYDMKAKINSEFLHVKTAQSAGESLQRGKTPPLTSVLNYDIKWSDGEAPVMLELWGMCSTFIAIATKSTLAWSGNSR